MNIFRQELKMARTSLLWWIIALTLVTLMFLSLYPAFSTDITQSRHMLEGFPPQLRAAMGMSLDIFSNFLGYYAYIFTYIGLAGAVQAMNLGLTMLGRETTSRTTDFLLTKPVTRTRVFVAKLASALAVLVITNSILIAITLLLTIMFSVGSFSLRGFALLALSFFLVQLVFLGLGILLSQFLKRVKSVVAVSLSAAFAFFSIGMIQAMTSDQKLRYLTPFKYFDHLAVIRDNTYEPKFVILTFVVIILATAIGYIIYRTRDARTLA